MPSPKAHTIPGQKQAEVASVTGSADSPAITQQAQNNKTAREEQTQACPHHSKKVKKKSLTLYAAPRPMGRGAVGRGYS